MRNALRDNSLTLVLLSIFLVCLILQGLTGWQSENESLKDHGLPAISFGVYFSRGEFLSSLFENWESEFLQMWAFVMLTAYLVQRGSPDSRDPDGKEEPQDRDPALDEDKPDAPWPVRAGGLVRVVYSHSLGLALLGLFIASFVLHWVNSARFAKETARVHGAEPPTFLQHLASAEFWFESFQNWQSEFLSTAVLIVLAIFLRERRSQESKAVGTPHAQTSAE
jgi:hypothetical protein